MGVVVVVVVVGAVLAPPGGSCQLQCRCSLPADRVGPTPYMGNFCKVLCAHDTAETVDLLGSLAFLAALTTSAYRLIGQPELGLILILTQ